MKVMHVSDYVQQACTDYWLTVHKPSRNDSQKIGEDVISHKVGNVVNSTGSSNTTEAGVCVSKGYAAMLQHRAYDTAGYSAGRQIL
jgi:hypothetical protein